jgi:hypothetical protein
MIIIKLQERLGNQLFQYAFGYALSKKLKTNLFFKPAQKNYLEKYFSLRPFESIRNIFCPKTERFKVIKQLGHEDLSDFKSSLVNNCYYDGYFQSEQYFDNVKTELKKLFEIKPLYRKPFEEKYGAIFRSQKTMCLHIRRSDYANHNYLGFPEFKKDLTDIRLPLDYYWKCLSQKNYDDYYKFIVTDDYDFVKQEFGSVPNVHIETNDEITDFQLMLHSQVVCIANSSFSWWAAWLNKTPEKTIYAPKYWFGFKIKEEYPLGIIPEDWVQIEPL